MKYSRITDKFQDECGVFGIFSDETIELSHISYAALSALQHRGQESCGIAIFDGETMTCYKGMGLVSSVFTRKGFNNFMGKSAVGHVRYSTSGESNLRNAQPILSEGNTGKIAIAHNGNITNANALRNGLKAKGIKFQTSTDSEVILKTIENEDIEFLEDAVEKAMEQINGGYSVLLFTDKKLIGFRDPKGIRPLCIGKLNNSYVLCSESCALDTLGAEFIRDVNPGEIVTIDSTGLKSNNYHKKLNSTICAFEYIYFARPNSVIDGASVYESRINMGKKLWEEQPVFADLIIGVPDSGVLAAVGFAKASGIPYDVGIIKNEYVGRTFIEPLPKVREANVQIKLNIIRDSIKGKKVAVVDDSIVRGTTSKKVVELIREAGAKEIHFRSASPVIKYPCFWGINTSHSNELIGSINCVDEVNKFIGSDSLGYLSIEGLLLSLGIGDKVCIECFRKVNKNSHQTI